MTASLDVTDPTAATRVVSDAVDHFGRIDVLVNNAGYGLITAFEEMSPEQIHQQFATNVYGVMNVTRAVLPVMRRQRSGHLFTIASMGGYLGGSRGTAYAVFQVCGGRLHRVARPRTRGVRHHRDNCRTRILPHRFSRPDWETAPCGSTKRSRRRRPGSWRL
jgi:NAD(P)-dependent dehydrogenase (short-subunit alcohol dehydrogenase family)